MFDALENQNRISIDTSGPHAPAPLFLPQILGKHNSFAFVLAERTAIVAVCG